MFQSTISGTVELKDLNVKKVINNLMDSKPATYESHRTLGLELHKKFCPDWDLLTPEQHEAILYWFDKSPDCERRSQERRAEDKMRAKGLHK